MAGRWHGRAPVEGRYLASGTKVISVKFRQRRRSVPCSTNGQSGGYVKRPRRLAGWPPRVVTGFPANRCCGSAVLPKRSRSASRALDAWRETVQYGGRGYLGMCVESCWLGVVVAVLSTTSWTLALPASTSERPHRPSAVGSPTSPCRGQFHEARRMALSAGA